jgi:UDP-N-acetylglucosamine 1-carboxyvinyltransferase
MPKLIIEGGKKLQGAVRVAGMKNAATPILAACLLATKKCVIKNIPDIADVGAMVDILRDLGLGVSYGGHTATIIPGPLTAIKRADLVRKLRSSILILGPILAREKQILLPEPGGCIIGKRPIDTHLYALEKLGARVRRVGGKIQLKAERLAGDRIVMPEFSVTATENLIMAASLAAGKTVIKLAAIEPHVQDLIKFLTKMGAVIKFGNEHTIVVEGVKSLGGASHTLIPDSIEAGTFAIAALITNGRLAINGVSHGHLDAVYALLERIGARLELKKNALLIFPKNKLRAFKFQSLPYPGLPTDLQAPFGVLATQCRGTSMIHDPMYEGRLGYISELVKMGADATVCDPHRVLISGPTKLAGASIEGLDLRAGATLVLAGLIARGTTVVSGAENLDRGYEKFDERLRKLGADIKRVND